MSDCTLPLVAVENNNCATLGLGQQISQILYQDTAGEWPTLDTEANAQAAMTAAAPDKLFTIKNLAQGLIPAAQDQSLTGADLPYGGTQVTNRANTMTLRLQYIGTSTTAAVNNFNKRGGYIRVGLVDNLGFLLGPIENVSASFSNLIMAGVGQNIPSHYILTLSWEGLDTPAISATPKPFLKNLTNAA